MMNILFRADSSSTIGTGHIMRDLVLASQYQDSNIIFATQDLSGNVNHKIIEAGYEIITLKTNANHELSQIVAQKNINMVVIDHYDIDYDFEKQLKMKYPTLKTMVLDDTYEKHHCDILLNHNISADKKRYKGLVPKDCELRCGSKYTLLREEFYKAKKQKNVFLAMGGTDHANLNIKILKVLQDFKNLQTVVVTTDANKNLDTLKKYVKNKKNITLHVNSNNIAQLMKQSDFAILTPSVTVNEAHFMNIPFIAIKTADNQKDVYKYLQKERYLTLSKFKKNRLKSSIKAILKAIK